MHLLSVPRPRHPPAPRSRGTGSIASLGGHRSFAHYRMAQLDGCPRVLPRFAEIEQTLLCQGRHSLLGPTLSPTILFTRRTLSSVSLALTRSVASHSRVAHS